MSMIYEKKYKVLIKPHVSEKTNRLLESHNQYVFQVMKTATKKEIKVAVQDLFQVEVKSVKTVLLKGKTKRTRYGLGSRSDWKKAYISLEQGQEIDFAMKVES